MGSPEVTTPRPERRGRRRLLLVALTLLTLGLVVFALSRLDLSRVGHALVTARPAWIAVALVLMGSSLVMRSISWQQTLRAALPERLIAWPPVVRATMIGVMGSAVFPGRIGEPSRVVIISRRIGGPQRTLIPIVAGTVFSQTLVNLLALVILAAIAFSGVPLLHGHETGIVGALALPLLLCALVVSGPRLLRRGERSRSPRLRRYAGTAARTLALARQGLRVFSRPRHGLPAVLFQLLAWALQWLSCYAVLLALHLPGGTDLVTAAAILLAVNVSAILPATPSNVGVFQAACLVVLAAYNVGSGPGLAYGLLLQAVEVVTALGLGVPALLGEGLTWRDIRRAGDEEIEQASAGDGAQ